MSREEDGREGSAPRLAPQPLHYRLCPVCTRAVPVQSGERYCINDGTRMLECCPSCGARITSPYSRFCGVCGLALAQPPGQKSG